MRNKYPLTYRPLMARDARRAMHGTIGTSRRGFRLGTSFEFGFLERVPSSLSWPLNFLRLRADEFSGRAFVQHEDTLVLRFERTRPASICTVRVRRNLKDGHPVDGDYNATPCLGGTDALSSSTRVFPSPSLQPDVSDSSTRHRTPAEPTRAGKKHRAAETCRPHLACGQQT